MFSWCEWGIRLIVEIHRIEIARCGDGAGDFGFHIIIWLCLTRTGNYQIHETDIDRGLDFPI